MKLLLKILTWIGAIILLLGPATVFLTGCGSILPHSKTEARSLVSVEKLGNARSETLQHVVEGTRPVQATQPPVTVGGLWNKVDLKYDAPDPTKYRLSSLPQGAPYREETKWTSEAETTAGSNEKAWTKGTVTLPLGVTIALLGFGLLILLFAIQRWRNASASANAAFEAADTGIAALIKHARSKAMTSTDSGLIAHMNDLIGTAEAERGKIAAR